MELELIEQDDTYITNQIIQERQQSIYEIEGKLIDVKEIFNDLAVLVENQQDHVDNIEMSISKAVEHTNQGVKELEKANKHAKKCIIL